MLISLCGYRLLRILRRNFLTNTLTESQLSLSYSSTHPRRLRGSHSGTGEIARRKFSRTGEEAPGYRVLLDHFHTASRMPAPDWAKKILCIIAPNRRTTTLKSLSCVLTCRLLSCFFARQLKTCVAQFRPPPTDCPWDSEDE